MPPLLVLQARAEARALLWHAGEYDDVDAAVEALWEHADETGLIELLGVETITAIIDAAFDRVSE